MQKRLARLVIMFVGIFLSFNSYAWNAVGHKVAAKIAYDNLTPEVRTKVDAMLVNFQKEYPNMKSFADLAPWADELIIQKNTLYTHWHYADASFSADNTPVKNLLDTDNAFAVISQLEVALDNEQANPFERARSLAFLVHIIPDVHQPLHTVSRISAAHPDGDRGGNLFFMPSLGNKPHVSKKSGSNLHAIWDSGLGVFDVEDTDENVNNLAATISKMYPEAYFSALPKDFVLADWSNEGYTLATTFVYATPEGQMPDEEYVSKGKEYAKQRVALAGYRLAGVLNNLLGTAHSF